ncbi:MAG: insulinase family protein [Myxococcales bacterium]|nr:insulinase family protein [Myxococcales bacterium]
MLATNPIVEKQRDGRWRLQHHEWVMPCGLRVMCAPDLSVRNVAVSVYYHVGASDEATPRSGQAHLFEHVFKNSAHVPRHHYEILRDAGAKVANAATSYDYTMYYEVVPHTQVALALWLESDRMGYWAEAMTTERLSAQQQVVQSERAKRYEMTAYGPENLAANRLMFPAGTPLAESVIGAVADIASTTLDDLRAHYRRWYVPANATLCVAGGMSLDETRRLVDAYFGSFPASSPPVRAASQLPAHTAATVEVGDNLASHRRLRWMWRVPSMPSRQAAALDAFAAIWSRRGTGDLWQQLLYHAPQAQAISVATHSHRTTGEFHIVVDLQAHADAAAVADIVRQSMARARLGVGDGDLRRLEERREARFLRSLEQPSARGDLLQHSVLRHGSGDGYLTDWALRQGLTPADVRDAVAGLLSWDRALMVATTPTR